MNISRRKFLGRGSALSVAAMVPLVVRAAVSEDSTPLSGNGLTILGTLTSKSFERLLNQTFKVQLSAMEHQELELIRVSRTTKQRHCESFDILFAGMDKPFIEGTYTIQHETLGSFPLFLVPVGPAQNGPVYQAVFTRLI
jgi:uncharacterized protein DUF6916